MKRFMLFEYDDYNACGGMDDFVDDYDNLQDALERIKICVAQLISVYDTARMCHVLHRYRLIDINYNKIGELFEKLRGEGKTIIVATHDEKLIKYAHRILEMEDGQIITDNRIEDVTFEESPETEESNDDIPDEK